VTIASRCRLRLRRSVECWKAAGGLGQDFPGENSLVFNYLTRQIGYFRFRASLGRVPYMQFAALEQITLFARIGQFARDVFNQGKSPQDGITRSSALARLLRAPGR
jgi:hypothetical protein